MCSLWSCLTLSKEEFAEIFVWGDSSLLKIYEYNLFFEVSGRIGNEIPLSTAVLNDNFGFYQNHLQDLTILPLRAGF